MRKSQEVIGLSVIDRKTGGKVGTVCDLLFDDKQQWIAILLECSGWLKRRKVVTTDGIFSVGKDAVILYSSEAIQPLDEKAHVWTGLLSGDHRLRGRPMLSDTGMELGTIQNVYFLEKRGTLVGYELSDGFMSDLQLGRKVLTPEEPVFFGKDVCMVPADKIRFEQAQ